MSNFYFTNHPVSYYLCCGIMKYTINAKCTLLNLIKIEVFHGTIYFIFLLLLVLDLLKLGDVLFLFRSERCRGSRDWCRRASSGPIWAAALQDGGQVADTQGSEAPLPRATAAKE